jgi:glycosyltransferase involved in cell wall biosynthesis
MTRRVLVVAPQPFYEDRGTPIAVGHVLRALVELGYRVDVLTFPIGRTPELPGVRIFRTRNPLGFRSVPIGFSLKKVFLDVLMWRELRKRLESEPYLCVQAVEEAAFLAVWACRRRGVPVVYDMQSSLPEQLALRFGFRNPLSQAFARRCEAWLLRSSDHVVCSWGLGERIRRVAPQATFREWRFPSELPPAAPAAVEALRRELEIPPGAPVVAYTGTFEAYQGLPLLLEAIPTVLADCPEAVFVLVGARGERQSQAARAALDPGHAQRVRIVPRQPRGRIPTFLALADVLVSPRAHGGNVPLKLFEYLAAERPIVATDIPTHRTILNDRPAVLVEVSAEALAKGICRLLVASPPLGSEGATRTDADGADTWERFVADVGELYRDLTGRSPRNGA